MKNITLIIPAKYEKESLPSVLLELKKYQLKTIVILESTDFETIDSIKNFNCSIVHQINKGYGNALILGCLLYTSPSPRDGLLSRMPSSA